MLYMIMILPINITFFDILFVHQAFFYWLFPLVKMLFFFILEHADPHVTHLSKPTIKNCNMSTRLDPTTSAQPQREVIYDNDKII